jgi:LuxR family transcriptional regulator
MASSKSVLPTPQNALAVAILSTFAIAKAETLGLSPSISADEASALRSLSPPQREILKWVAAGKSNFDIATILGLPERTVRYHVSEILRKLGVVSRSQAVVIGKSGKVV